MYDRKKSDMGSDGRAVDGGSGSRDSHGRGSSTERARHMTPLPMGLGKMCQRKRGLGTERLQQA